MALSGSDSSGDGSVSNPWRTIQHAVNQAQPGWIINVDGTSGVDYGENISISNSGTAAEPITLVGISGQPKVLNFTISGSYWTVDNFDVSNQAAGDGVATGYGFLLSGNASHDTIENSYIHELCQEGVFMAKTVSYITVLNNTIFHAQMAGISIDGTNDLVQGNDISHTSQYPDRIGGIYSVCTERGGADADWIRFFGLHHVIQGNNLHDIIEPTVSGQTSVEGNYDPHTDCFQTWGNKSGTALRDTDDITIAGNRCSDAGQPWFNLNTGTNHAGIAESLNGATTRTIRLYNNVFTDLFQGFILSSSAGPIYAWNNTFDHIGQEAIDYNYTPTSADQVINNVFYDCGNGGDSYITTTAPTMASNNCIMRDGSACGTYPVNPAHTQADPRFMNSGDSTGVGADYHLQAGSPLLGTGTTVAGVTDDFDGVTRTAGAYSLGAYQQ